jgi:hypothetical protein
VTGNTFLDKTTLLHGLKRYVYTSLETWNLHHSSPELGLVSSLLCQVGGLPIPGHMGFQVSGSRVKQRSDRDLRNGAQLYECWSAAHPTSSGGSSVARSSGGISAN